MQIYESGEDYLEKILMLSREKEAVRAIDVATSMGFSKPSVSIALHKLEGAGFLNIQKNGNIELTNEGKKIAEEIYERHNVIASLLISIGVKEEQAYIDACKIEHDLSEESYQKLKEYQK